MPVIPSFPFFPAFPAVPAGSLIGVIAPAGPAEAEHVAQVPALYAAHGYRVRIYPGCHRRTGYLAGDDSQRLADLHAALADADVAAIHCLRGGYGCMRLLDGVDQALVQRARKLLIGYSDITALHALWRHAGLPSLHAPMPASDLLQPGPAANAAADAEALFTLLHGGLASGAVLAPLLDPAPRAAGLHHGGVAEGVLVGGNLSLVAALLGTPWAWPVDAEHGAILFLEDVGEPLYRIDRLLTQLRLAGVLHAVRDVLLGSFTETDAPAPLLHTLLNDLLQPLSAAHGKPLLAGWPSGHGAPNRPLPLGLRVRLDADAGRITLLQGLLDGPAIG